MKQTVRESALERAKPVLRIASSPRAAWDGAISDWIRDTAAVAWKRALPSLVVVPTRSHASALKARLLERGESHLGLQFVTPARLRKHFAAETAHALPLREHLRLLLAVAADETLMSQGAGELNDEKQAAKAVLRTPDHLLRTLERLDAAGWDFDNLQLRSFQPIVRRFREHLSAAGVGLAAETDRLALRDSAGEPPLFARVLVTGFDGAHWPYWCLLRAAVQATENATVLLEYPHGDSAADSCWIGSWEEAFGEATDVGSRENNSLDSFFTDEEMRGLGRAKRASTFLVGSDTSEQAEAVAFQCLRFLAEPTCIRVGVVFATTGALPRLVARALAKLEISHNDSIAHSMPGIFESGEWRAWLQLQQGPRINSLLRFINALPHRDELFSGLSIQAFERTLRSAHAEVLIDDLDILQRFCAQQPGETGQTVAEAVRSIRFLPARASLNEFLRETEAAFERPKWKPHWMEISRRLDDWMENLDIEFSRSLYLRWLGEIASTSTASREPAGDHPYARVQLLTLPEAHGQEWSHLIFAGWNEGSWPAPASGEFAREDEIAAFNRSIQNLNRHATRHGRQGEGHSAIRDNHSFYLGPFEQRQIALRQFETLLNSATAEVAFTAALAQESAPERIWNPSELFTRLYQQTHREPLTQATMSSLQKATAAWLLNARTLTKKTKLPSIQVEQTRVAYDVRRDPLTSAGEYDFAFRSRPNRVPILSVSEFEKLLSSPALVWMKKYLGVEAAEENANVWSSSSGKWIHGWLARIAGGAEKAFAPLPDSSEIDRRIRAAAEQKEDEVARLCQAAGKPLPEWWRSGWRNALFLARSLGERLATAEGWPWMAAEWKIDDDLAVAAADGVTLSFRGRIDLLLSRHETAAGSLEAGELWIIDYKTGAKKALVAGREDAEKRRPALRKKLLDGSALQLGLYALAARALRARGTWISLLSPLVRPIAPQVSGAQIAAETDIFSELARMQQTGIFGMHGPLRSAYRYTEDYPLATLAIDPDVLEQRWERTHPALVRDEEDIFW